MGDSKVLPGDIAWKLYDTYGFPIDLTQLMSEERGLTVDMSSYEEAKQKAILVSQAQGVTGIAKLDLDVHAIGALKDKKFLATDDNPKYHYSSENGTSPAEARYQFAETTATILAIRLEKEFVEEANGGECGLILDRTNFYAEQGGQIFDEGYMTLLSSDGKEVSFGTYTGAVLYYTRTDIDEWL